MKDVVSVCWLRRDLRVSDNRALHAALETAAKIGGVALVVFVFDTEILDGLDRDDRRVAFLVESVLEVQGRLEAAGGGLVVLHGNASEVFPELLADLGPIPVFASGDFEPRALARDEIVERKLSRFGASFHRLKDHVVFEKSEVLTGSQTPFKVFTPYCRAWLAALESNPQEHLRHWPSEDLLLHVAATRNRGIWFRGLADIGFKVAAGLQERGGESAGHQRLTEFASRMADYATARDYPGIEGTSHLAIDLRFGTVSVREAVRQARARSTAGAAKWQAELVWREFYQALLWHFPQTIESPFQTRMSGVVWDDPATEPLAATRFEAWCQGRTGYPFVDAAMRELRATGWMHNRCRMVVASFLTKDLHLHWKHGERWFARLLGDFELASNVGGWQWAASTGADSQPWFRIFHPVTQSRNWDASGAWIRKWCPELSGIPDRWIHAPWEAPLATLAAAGVQMGTTWPFPIVEHASERLETLERFGRV